VGTVADREPFLAALVDHLREANAATVEDGGEDRFYAAKQRLLDQTKPGSDDALAIASIDWQEVQKRLSLSDGDD
jgi:hypothetical protein